MNRMRFFDRIAVLAFAFALTACGGGGGGTGAAAPTGGDAGILSAAQLAPPGYDSEIQKAVTPVNAQALAATIAATDASAFMDWAEIRYPKYFPSQQADKAAASFTYRYYQDTQTYLAVKDGTAYVLTGSTNVLVTLGALSQFGCAVFPENCAIANAGPSQRVLVGATVQLSGAASTAPAHGTLTYAWAMNSKPGGSTAGLGSLNSVTTGFRADLVGQYTFTLTVKDSSGSTSTATMSVTADTTNIPPTARPGSSQSVSTGSIVVLNGSASSDVNGKPLSYSWKLVDKPLGSTASLSGANTQATSFVGDGAGRYELSLVVSNGGQSSSPATVFVEVGPAAPSIVTPKPPSTSCCKVCTTGKACGDSCISRSYNCTKSGGCAC